MGGCTACPAIGGIGRTTSVGANAKAAICILFAAFALLAANHQGRPRPAVPHRSESAMGGPSGVPTRERSSTPISRPHHAARGAEDALDRRRDGYANRGGLSYEADRERRSVDGRANHRLCLAAPISRARRQSRFGSLLGLIPPNPSTPRPELSNASNATNPSTGDPASKSATPPASASAAASPPPPAAEVREPPRFREANRLSRGARAPASSRRTLRPPVAIRFACPDFRQRRRASVVAQCRLWAGGRASDLRPGSFFSRGGAR